MKVLIMTRNCLNCGKKLEPWQKKYCSHFCQSTYDNMRNYMTNVSEEKEKLLKDKQITMELINNGYIVLRFWECEINENVSKCVDKIEEAIKTERIVTQSAKVQ